jgi:hypothetical protein
MSDELTITAGIAFSKGSVAEDKLLSALVDVSGNDLIHNTQTVGTSEEALLLADVAVGYILMRNNDTANFVKVRAATGATDLIKILPGEFALFRMVASAPYVIADTGSCVLEYWMVEA